jgi:uncharacterized paraquat-inducible protein A
MTRMRPFEAERADASLQCDDCSTLALDDEPYCGACGGHLGPRKKSKVAYDAIATFIGVVAIILYFAGRG